MSAAVHLKVTPRPWPHFTLGGPDYKGQSNGEVTLPPAAEVDSLNDLGVELLHPAPGGKLLLQMLGDKLISIGPNTGFAVFTKPVPEIRQHVLINEDALQENSVWWKKQVGGVAPKTGYPFCNRFGGKHGVKLADVILKARQHEGIDPPPPGKNSHVRQQKGDVDGAGWNEKAEAMVEQLELGGTDPRVRLAHRMAIEFKKTLDASRVMNELLVHQQNNPFDFTCEFRFQ